MNPGRPLMPYPGMIPGFPGPPGMMPGMMPGMGPGMPGMMPPGMPYGPRPGFPPGMPGLRPGAPPTLPIIRPGASMALPPKSTSMYVGKIAPGVDDPTIQALLEACGPIKSWNRLVDSETQQPKGFGFVEYEEVEGVTRALQHLNNLALDGQELMLKPNTATQKYMDAYQARKEAEAKLKAPSKPAEGQEAAANGDVPAEDSLDDKALQQIMALVSERAPVKPSAAETAADKLLDSMELPPPPGPPPRSASRPSRRDSKSDDKKERDIEADFARQRERERHAVVVQQRESEAAYQDLLRQQDRHEKDRKAAREKEVEREHDVAKERLRQVLAENEAPSDTEEDHWRRPLYTGSRRAEDRKRRRKREQQEDDADREKEAAELAAAVAAPAEEESKPAGRETTAEVDVNDPIYQAMLTASKSRPHRTGPAPVSPLQGGDGLASPPTAAPRPMEAPPAKKRSLAAAFSSAEEEDQPKRRLIPLQYTAAELKAAQAANAAAAASSAEHNRKAIKELIDKIPNSKEGILKFQLKWGAYDSGGTEVSGKILVWVKKKVTELLGTEEDDSMATFVMEKLSAHTPPAKVLDELSAVLDEDAEGFVVKLYRMVIFESQKAALGLNESQP